MPRKQITPVNSPQKERYGDRFIPSRAGNNWQVNFNMIQVSSILMMRIIVILSVIFLTRYKTWLVNAESDIEHLISKSRGILDDFDLSEICDNLFTECRYFVSFLEVVSVSSSYTILFQDKSPAKKTGREGTEGAKDYSLSIYSSLLKNEILGAQIEDFKESSSDSRMPLQHSENRNLFSYRPRRSNIVNEPSSPYSLTPVSSKSVKLLRSPRKASRKISKIPFKVLDAPELQDDFYLNLVDWSSQNVLSVGLGACVYLWSAFTSQVTVRHNSDLRDIRVYTNGF